MWVGISSGFLPVVSIVVPFWGYLIKFLIIYLVKPAKGTTMETIGRFKVSGFGSWGSGARVLTRFVEWL